MHSKEMEEKYNRTGISKNIYIMEAPRRGGGEERSSGRPHRGTGKCRFN